MPKTHQSYNNIDLSGKKFCRLTAISIAEGHYSKWICRCECGNYKEVYAGKLIRGIVKSCGCLEKENKKKLKERTIKHGMTNTILYEKWCGMKERCYNPNYKYFYRYGGRGIKVCDEWIGEHGFENFMKWAYEAGYDDNKHTFEQTIDRKNTDGDYCPENCKWSNQKEQVRNRSNATLIEDIDGNRITSEEFSEKYKIDADNFVYRRVKKGRSAQSILDEWQNYINHNNGNYLSIKEAVMYYRVSDSTFKKWIKNGEIKADYVRNQYYILKGQPRPYYEEKYATKKKS